uniref:Ig-like domain-containing protein n=1 Tax=Astatotilapia calliptera TaxID=8154 RepID=A0AAX7SSP6_ASTCA
MKVVLLLALLTVCECDSSRVKGHTGQDVTLPCKYDRKYHGALSVCWQRGEIPTRGCSNPLISTDGLRVSTRASSRYELLGRLEDGDVSLTIMNLTEGDAGRYGCRVEIPGWFNDEKHHFDLSVATGRGRRSADGGGRLRPAGAGVSARHRRTPGEKTEAPPHSVSARSLSLCF